MEDATTVNTLRGFTVGDHVKLPKSRTGCDTGVLQRINLTRPGGEWRKRGEEQFVVFYDDDTKEVPHDYVTIHSANLEHSGG